LFEVVFMSPVDIDMTKRRPRCVGRTFTRVYDVDSDWPSPLLSSLLRTYSTIRSRYTSFLTLDRTHEPR